MADLTPELLAQLELLVGAGENFPLPLQSVTVRCLVAAAKERDQLRRQIEGSSLGAYRRQVAQLTEQRDRWRAEAETLRKEIFHHGEQVSVREAARRGTPLDGTDARTLEAALAATERERDQWRDVAARDDSLSEQLAESQLTRVTMAEELDKLRASIERIKSFVADNALVNYFELDAILKGETP